MNPVMPDVLFYVALVLFSSGLVLIGRVTKRKLPIIIGLSLVILYSGLRSNVGTDFQKYVLMYSEVTNTTFADFLTLYTVEPTFYILSILSKLLFDSPFLVFFVMSLLTVVFFYKGLLKYTDKATHITFAWLAYLLLLFPNTMNIARQGLAISIVFYAFSFIATRQLGKYLKWITIATLFHYSTIVLLPAYLLNRIISRKYGDSFNQVRIFFFSFVVAILLPLLVFLSTRALPLPEKYANYISGADPGANILFYLVAFVMLCITAVFTLYKNKKDYKIMYLYLFSMLMAALLFAGFFIDETRRISLYFLPYFALLIPVTVAMVPKGIARNIAWLLALMYVGGYFITFYVLAGYGDTFPYQTIFSGGYDVL